MDHQQQHHEHHQKAREREKKREAEHEREVMASPGGLHPGWFYGAGIVLVVAALVIWTLFLS